ncbi:cobalt ABC transporter ATP-binding subunit [Entomoplasma ellychniae]|uniref:Cobalt ABC transporter ATP-binding subunit n=1 Tax=Entomoplasma ellychniae TaxID=2114 RepID=A0A8E2UA98_9MOLU|nr:energy-coupling factor transporter ATPase [Entomoplasma ellychniae]PPE04949.1 cobalt ABC transporter ATP-binding subunit [Entomoplasma ellychniae]
MPESLKKFQSTKLSEKDINDFKKELHNAYLEFLKANNEFYKINQKYKQKQVNKKEVAKVVEIKKQKSKAFKLILKEKKFKENLKFISKVNKNLSTKNSSIVFEKSKEELIEAKKIYKEFLASVKEMGRGAELDQLNDIAIKAENINFKYNFDLPYVLNDVSFEIKKGEYVTVIGHNGSGKSTLSKLLIGALQPESGHLSLFGNYVTIDTLDQARRFLGIVFQNPDNQFIGSSVEADIAFGLENKRVEPKLMHDQIYEAAKKVGMENFLDKEPLMLSGGQKQRVAIASVLALSPEILIFDEATSMLDPKGNREVKEIMVDLRDNMGKTVISITHDMDEILNADKVIVMNKGQMVKFGTPEEVLKEKEFLRSIKLDVPFLSLVEEALEKEGIKIKHSNTMDELVSQIC